MKKSIAAIVLAMTGFILFLPASAAAATEAQTNVTGVVSDGAAKLSNARVVVECNKQARTDRTDANGAYLVTFKAKECPAGSTLNVTARQGKKGGYSSGVVGAITTKLNIGVVGVSVPEFGQVAGMTAALGAGGLFVVKRKKVSEQVL